MPQAQVVKRERGIPGSRNTFSQSLKARRDVAYVPWPRGEDLAEEGWWQERLTCGQRLLTSLPTSVLPPLQYG